MNRKNLQPHPAINFFIWKLKELSHFIFIFIECPLWNAAQYQLCSSFELKISYALLHKIQMFYVTLFLGFVRQAKRPKAMWYADMQWGSTNNNCCLSYFPQKAQVFTKNTLRDESSTTAFLYHLRSQDYSGHVFGQFIIIFKIKEGWEKRK